MTKVGEIVDLHHNTCAPYSWFLWPTNGDTGEWRVCSTALARLQDALDTFYALGIKRVLDLGDMIDFGIPVGGETWNDMLDDIIAVYQASDFYIAGGRIIALQGNHETSRWDGSPHSNSDWVDRIDNIHVTRENTYSILDNLGSGDDSVRCYTYDYDGVRFIMLNYVPTAISSAFDPTNWFEDRITETSLPVVICCHVPAGSTCKSQALHTQAWQDILIANDNVKMILSGHDHRGYGGDIYQDMSWPDNSGFDSEVTYAQDVWWFSGKGGVRPINTVPKDDDYDSDAGAGIGVHDACHYILEIIPDSVKTSERMRANVKITGYRQAESDTKAFLTYGAM